MRAKYHRLLAIQVVMAAALVAMLMFGPKQPDGKPSLGVLTVMCVVGWGVTLFNWKCPSCSGYLGKALYHRSCPSCGISFNED